MAQGDDLTDNVPDLETQRLVLRAPLKIDISDMVAQLSNWEQVRYTANFPHPYLPRDAKAFIDRNQSRPIDDLAGYAVIRKADRRWVGLAGFSRIKNGEATLGYVLGVEFFGQGYMQEALATLITDAFTRLSGLSVIKAEVFLANERSRKLLARLGFVYVQPVLCLAQARGGEFPGGAFRLTRGDWESR